MKNKQLKQIKNKIEEMRIYIKDCENLINEYEGSYTLHQLELNCDRIEESNMELKDLLDAAQENLNE